VKGGKANFKNMVGSQSVKGKILGRTVLKLFIIFPSHNFMNIITNTPQSNLVQTKWEALNSSKQ
jgi:predicted proteasome-type protease